MTETRCPLLGHCSADNGNSVPEDKALAAAKLTELPKLHHYSYAHTGPAVPTDKAASPRTLGFLPRHLVHQSEKLGGNQKRRIPVTAQLIGPITQGRP